MSIPLVSVITTVYNNDKYIEESLRSIFNQTFKDFELIVFNDCSTDNTWEVIEKTFCDFDGDYIIINSDKKENIGCGLGRNMAISRAKGKYIAISDGDDISYSDRLEKEVKFIESHPDIFFVGSWCDVINSNGNHIKVYKFPKEDHNDFVRDLYRSENTIIDPTSLFRKEVFDKLGGYNSTWSIIPDLHLWVSAMIGGYYFYNIQESLVAYRKHGGSVTSNYYIHCDFQHNLLNKTILFKHKKEVFFRN